MSPIRPMLGDVELEQVQRIESEEDQVLTRHEIPALEGDFLQRLGRRGSRVLFSGVLTGPESGAGLQMLREKFHAAEPVPFAADITTATQVDEVLIEELAVREVAGRPERFEYAVAVREFTEPPAVASEEAAAAEPSPVDSQVNEEAEGLADEQVEEIAAGVGTLRVRVVSSVEGADTSHLAVLVEGTGAEGESRTFLLDEEVAGVYSKEGLPSGEYLVRAVRS